MVHSIVPFSDNNTTFLEKLMKFQKYIFRRIYEAIRYKGRVEQVQVQSAKIEIIEGKVSSPHFLIMFEDVHRKVKDPICIQQRRVKDPTEARAYGFFYIAQYLNQFIALKEEPPVIIHVGNTTIVAP